MPRPDAGIGDVMASLNYLRPCVAPLRTYAYDPPDGSPRFNGSLEPWRMAIRNARDSVRTLASDGFTCVPHRSAVRRWHDDDALPAVLYPECEALVRELTGAPVAIAFDHTLRRRAPGRPPLDGMGGSFAALREPVGRVHLDYTRWSAPRRRDEVLAAAGRPGHAGRYLFIGLWRALHEEPLQDAPLALADARSVASCDLVPNDLVYPHRRGQTYAVLHNPHHAWSHYPGLTREEVLAFVHYDGRTDADGAPRAVPHTAFEHPATPAGAAPRHSIELRVLALLED